MSRPAKVVAALILVGAAALAIAGYFVVSGGDEAYWAALIPVFVFIYAGIAIAVVFGLDSAIRWGIGKRRSRFAEPS
jgi:hypothetical protein